MVLSITTSAPPSLFSTPSTPRCGSPLGWDETVSTTRFKKNTRRTATAFEKNHTGERVQAAHTRVRALATLDLPSTPVNTDVCGFQTSVHSSVDQLLPRVLHFTRLGMRPKKDAHWTKFKNQPVK